MLDTSTLMKDALPVASNVLADFVQMKVLRWSRLKSAIILRASMVHYARDGQRSLSYRLPKAVYANLSKIAFYPSTLHPSF